MGLHSPCKLRTSILQGYFLNRYRFLSSALQKGSQTCSFQINLPPQKKQNNKKQQKQKQNQNKKNNNNKKRFVNIILKTNDIHCNHFWHNEKVITIPFQAISKFIHKKLIFLKSPLRIIKRLLTVFKKKAKHFQGSAKISCKPCIIKQKSNCPI